MRERLCNLLLHNQLSTICLVRQQFYWLVLATGHQHAQTDNAGRVDIFAASGAVVNGEYLAGSSGRKSSYAYCDNLSTGQRGSLFQGILMRVSLHISVLVLSLQVPEKHLWRMATTLDLWEPALPKHLAVQKSRASQH